MENDPDDELKGGALLATWPNHLTAEELFSALSPRKKAISGLYQRFLWSDIPAKIAAEDMCVALDWARRQVKRASSEIDPLARISVSIVVAAIDLFREPGVCERLADILIAREEQFEQRLRTGALYHARGRRPRCEEELASGKTSASALAEDNFTTLREGLSTEHRWTTETGSVQSDHPFSPEMITTAK
jgi:hypothetical protein